jgi:A/G-specific adenine glycosylase
VDLDHRLLAWYRHRRTAYPWRGDRDPYRVLVSEVMLQQTQAQRVVPAFNAFLERFPSVRALAAAPRAEVVRAWGNLGYNRRAVALSEAARAIVQDHGGRIPDDPAVLRVLPGIGPYTASAIAALAYGRPTPALDVNVRRVVARARLGSDPEESRPADVARAAREWLDGTDPADWHQAVMDLGRVVCRPVPRCPACPLEAACAVRIRPRHVPTRHRPRRAGEPFVGSRRHLRGRVVALLRERHPRSLGALAASTDSSVDRVAEVVRAMTAERIVSAGPAAIRGSPRGSVRLAG